MRLCDLEWRSTYIGRGDACVSFGRKHLNIYLDDNGLYHMYLWGSMNVRLGSWEDLDVLSAQAILLELLEDNDALV